MKTRTLTLISITLLATLVLGATFTLTQAQKPVGAGVKWDPKYYTWDTVPPPDPWTAAVSTHGGHKAQTEINVTTVLLEGLYSPGCVKYPSDPNYAPSPALHGPALNIPFDGWDVKAAIEPKLPGHMGILIPGTYRISLTITGKLYSGETFSGDGVVVVTVPNSPPP